MALIDYTPIQDGTVAQASQVNTPLSTIYDEFNGNISAVNLADNAVSTNKIQDGAVTPAKLTPRTAIRVLDGGQSSITVDDLDFAPVEVEFRTTFGSNFIPDDDSQSRASYGWGISTIKDEHYSYFIHVVDSFHYQRASDNYSIIANAANGGTRLNGKVTSWNSNGVVITMDNTTSNYKFLAIFRG